MLAGITARHGVRQGWDVTIGGTYARNAFQEHPLLGGTLLVSAVGAGGGVAGWFELFYPEPIALEGSFVQDDFDSPVFKAITLDRSATLTVQATATHIVHNPHYGDPGLNLGAGVSLEIYLDNQRCAVPPPVMVREKIMEGDRRLQIDALCNKELGPGQHFIRMDAVAIGNCKPLSHVPKTCNTRRIRGAYALIE